MARLSWDKIKLSFLISTSKRIPKDYKYALKTSLVSEFEMKGLQSTKDLFTYICLMDSYDVHTSLILAVHYGNWLSCDILLRAQIEIFLFSNWLKNNLNEIKDIFKREVYDKDKNLKEYYKLEKDEMILFFWELYNRFYSQKAHPLPMRYFSSIDFLTMLKPRSQDLDFSQIMKKSFNKLPAEDRIKKMNELFEEGDYSPGVSAIPHTKDKKKSKHLIVANFYLYNRIKENMDYIQKNAPEYNMTKDEWTKSIKKYRKDGYFLGRDNPL